MNTITPFLWFDGNAEEAMKTYLSIFRDSKQLDVQRAGPNVMSVTFELLGQRFIALNGGPMFRFNEAVSFFVSCDTQAEVDHYWDALGAGGTYQPCGWLKDRFGVSWQVVPKVLGQLLGDKDPQRAKRAMDAMLKMKKLDIAALEAAAAG